MNKRRRAQDRAFEAARRARKQHGMDGKFGSWDPVLNELENNSFAIFADASGARLVAKLRGATATEMGLMLGAAQASLSRQIESIREHVLRMGGQTSADWFDGGLIVGASRADYHEGLMLRERPDTKEPKE